MNKITVGMTGRFYELPNLLKSLYLLPIRY